MEDQLKLAQLTAEVVTAYVAANRLEPGQIRPLIQQVHGAFVALAHPQEETATAGPRLTAAQIRKSITPDALISFEDGKPYKQLKRHLRTRGLTPADYRAKWGLPDDYPTTAANYSAQRSELAKKLGLGRETAAAKARAAAAQAAPAPAAAEAPQQKVRPKGRLSLFGRRSTEP